jgi:translation initiation factor IF-2
VKADAGAHPQRSGVQPMQGMQPRPLGAPATAGPQPASAPMQPQPNPFAQQRRGGGPLAPLASGLPGPGQGPESMYIASSTSQVDLLERRPSQPQQPAWSPAAAAPANGHAAGMRPGAGRPAPALGPMPSAPAPHPAAPAPASMMLSSASPPRRMGQPKEAALSGPLATNPKAYGGMTSSMAFDYIGMPVRSPPDQGGALALVTVGQ